jgi:hypothetical protein
MSAKPNDLVGLKTIQMRTSHTPSLRTTLLLTREGLGESGGPGC